MRTLLTLIAAAALTFASAQDFVFGLNYDDGGKYDGSFNEGTFNGMERAIADLESQLGLEIDLLEFEGTPATSAAGLRNIASAGADLIIAPGFNQGASVATVAAEYEDTLFVIIDTEVEAPNVRSYLFKEHEGSFLVGVIAGTLSQTGVVGFVGGAEIPLIRAFDFGYQQGVVHACPECRVISNYVGGSNPWNDPTSAKELATVQHAQGADIIYAAAGGSGRGVRDFVFENMCHEVATRRTPLTELLQSIPTYAAYDAVCPQGSQPLFFIGVDSNQNFEGDFDDDPTTLNHGLTSMLKTVDRAAYDTAFDVVNGTFEAGTVVLGLAEEGVGFALDEYNEALIPATLLDELRDISEAIISGELVVIDAREQ